MLSSHHTGYLTFAIALLACVQRAGCGTGAEVVDCGWDGGHDWPRKGEDQFSVDVIWEFFEKHGRRSHE